MDQKKEDKGPFAEVALPLAVPLLFTYRIKKELLPFAKKGCRVLVPFRTGARTGIIVHTTDRRPKGVKRILFIVDVLDRVPVIPPIQLKLLLWISKYYHAFIGETIQLAVPNALSKKAIRKYSFSFFKEESSQEELNKISQKILKKAASIQIACSAKHLLAAIPEAKHFHLLELEKAGRLTSQYFHKEKVKVLTETMISRTQTPIHKTPGSKQKLIIEFLEKHGETSFQEFRELYKITRSTIKSLQNRNLISTREEEVFRDPFRRLHVEKRTKDPILTVDQEKAVNRLTEMLSKGGIALLHGVTGSGKTEVYLRVIRKVIAKGQRALVLLPEIGLTPQFVGVFRAALGDNIAVQHSGLTQGERFDQWRQIRDGNVQIVIGARSAIFAPIQKLGVIIVDEEHDGSFKQNDGVRYHARDVATVLGGLTNSLVILGSATPSLESIKNANDGRYLKLSLPTRVEKRPMPVFNVIDMRFQQQDKTNPMSRYVSDRLINEVKNAVLRKEQVILFLNRRGYASFVNCDHCGQTLECASCDITLTYHHRGKVVRCHYCGASEPKPNKCPACGSDKIELMGIGTEQIERYIQKELHEFKIGRLDRDSSRGSRLVEILNNFRRGELDVLIGTQMVTKGHDFHNVTLVGVINADQSLKFPDFRAGEHTFQLLTQVAGRAGRGKQQGNVFLQTYDPMHFTIRAVLSNDFVGSVKKEFSFRKRLHYPPFGHLIAFQISGINENYVFQIAHKLVPLLQHKLVEVLGPVKASLYRANASFRMQLLIKSITRKPLHELATKVLAFISTQNSLLQRQKIKIAIDVDPFSTI